MRAAGHSGIASIAAQRGRCGTTRAAHGLGGAYQRQHRVALVARRCYPALATSLLDISARSAVPIQGRARILDLYERRWQGQPLRLDEFVISTDEKTSIQARLRIHPSLPTAPGASMRVEHEYARGGAWAYLAAMDVHRAKVFGRCEATTGIVPFERLVDQVMSQPPYSTARRVFWVMDNGSSHRGEASIRRLTQAHPTLVPVHGPVHASWLNQIEIYFSIVQRKVLTPNDFPSLAAVAERLFNFERYYESIAHPFEWKFTRADLNALIARMRDRWARSQSWKLAA